MPIQNAALLPSVSTASFMIIDPVGEGAPSFSPFPSIPRRRFLDGRRLSLPEVPAPSWSEMPIPAASSTDPRERQVVELHRDVSCRTPSQSRLMSFSASSSRDQGHPDALSASRVKAARTIFLVGISRPGEKPGSAAAKEKPASRDPAP